MYSVRRCTNLETVHLDRLLGKSLFHQKVGYLDPLVTLKLDDLAKLFVVDECAVASEFLCVYI